MAILAQDSFNRANSTTSLGVADTGQTWQYFSANSWGISSNQAYCSTGAVNNSCFVDVGVSVDTKTSVKINVIEQYSALAVRRNSNPSTNEFYGVRYNNGILQVVKVSAGGTSTLGSGSVTMVNGDTLSVECIGTSIKAYVNSVLIVTVTDSSYTNYTGYGLYLTNRTTTRFDDFKVEDFSTGGGDTGTDGSITLGLTQQIYADSSVNLSLSQQIYADISANLNLIQAIYNDAEALLNLTQAVYRDSDTGLNLTQEIYAEAESILSLIQEFYEDSQTYITLQLIQQIYNDSSADLPLTQAIYQDSNIELPLRQEVYDEKENTLNLLQTVYKDDSAALSLSQTIYKDSFSTLNTVQQMYTDGEISLPLLIQIRDDLVNLVGVIRLIGKRVLNVPLQGKRELNVTLKGGIDVTAINQNFSMIAGDTKSLIATMSEDLSGASVRWVIKKNVNSTENILLKASTVSGTDITIKLDPADTLSLVGTYYHECEVTDQQNNVSTVFTGMCLINKSGI
jgi:hypothetical protein